MDEDNAPAAAEEAPADDAGDEEISATEAEARRQGWVPREEYRGDPADWTDADEYIRMGDPKYLRKALKDTRKGLSKLEKQLQAKDAEFAERLDRFERMSKAQRAKLYSDIEAARRQAVAEGDTDRYDELNRAEAQLYEQEQAAAKPAPKKADQPEVHPEVEAWVQANPWFLKDKVLNRAAAAINDQIAEDEPDLSIAESLERTRAEIIRRFPEKFGRKLPVRGVTAVEGGQRMPAARGGKGWNDIPPDDRKIIARHIEEGLYKDQADAAKAYWRA